MEAQTKYDRLQEIGDSIKTLTEEKNKILSDFYEEYEDYELPIDVDGKTKYMRVHKPDGRYVYNIEYELGVRVTPKKKFEDKKDV